MQHNLPLWGRWQVEDLTERANTEGGHTICAITIAIRAYVADGAVSLRYRVLGEDNSVKDYVCPAVLVNGSHYVHLRQMAKSLGLAVYYEETTKKILLYPPEYYTESDVQNRLVKNSDYTTPMDKVMAGLDTEGSSQ